MEPSLTTQRSNSYLTASSVSSIMVKLLPTFLALLLVTASLASEKEDVSTEEESDNGGGSDDGGMGVVQEGRNMAAWQGNTSAASSPALPESLGIAHSFLCRSPFSSKGLQGCRNDNVEQRVIRRLGKSLENMGINTYLGVPLDKWRSLGLRKIQCGMSDSKCSLRRRRDVEKEEITVEEGVAASGKSSEKNGTKGEELLEPEREETKGEELPEPEALAWIDPGRLASQGVTMEHVPSLANLMGLRVVKYKTQHPQHFQATYKPQLHPRQPPSRNQQVAAATTNMRLTPLQKPPFRFDAGNPSFGNSFHDTFDKYYKSFNQQEMQGIHRISNNHGRVPVETSSYSDPPPRIPSLPANVPFRFPSGGVRPQPPPNTFARPPYSSLGNTADTFMQMLNPFNLLGSNQFPQLPRYPHPVPPPNYDPRKPHGFQHFRPTETYGAEVKDIPKGDIKYEVLMDPNQDLHQGYQFKDDSPLRDDLYVGQDGNLYLKDSSASSKTPDKNNFESDDKPPNSSPPINPPSQDSHQPHPTSPSEGRFEDEDIDTFNDDFDEDFSDEYEDSSYAQLLENHNMNDQDSREPSGPVQDFSQDYFRNGPHRPFREPTIPGGPNLSPQVHYPNVANNPYVIRTPSNSFLNSGLFGWLFSPYSRTNYPTYYYNPKEIILPRFMYPRGPNAHVSNSPPAGSLSNAPDANYPRYPPLSQGPPRPSPLNPSLARPLFSNPSLVRPPVPSPPPPRSQTQYPFGPLQHIPSRPHQSLQPSPSTSPNTRHHNIAQGANTHLRANLEHGHETGTGFYPGNGFFDSDFPTLYHMTSSKRNRFMEALPRPMGQNATAIPPDDED